MIATITSQSHGIASTVEFPVMLNSNKAGAPLPLIPRRSSSALRAHAGSSSSSTTPKTSPVKITVQQATPPKDDDNSSSCPTTPRSAPQSSSSSASPQLVLQSKITRSTRKPLSTPAEAASPLSVPHSKKEGFVFPSKHDSNENERQVADPSSSKTPSFVPVRLTLEGLPSRALSESHVDIPSAQPTHKSAPVENPSPPLVIRKKSGQLVKPSLKSRSSFKGSLAINHGGIATKSEPATPTVSKAVHFDSRLEHVKLFLAEQRPLAVSRDGSPTDDTSGTESDFPSFIYGDSSDKKTNGNLTMKVVNMPSIVNLKLDIVLQDMKISAEGTNIVGRVRVRNLAYHKWVAVRFTFDAWQTTSEVTAKYIESAGKDVDIFSFTIRLNDLLARIDEKTLVIALRYNVDGREIWDNNLGRNYVVKFAWETPEPPRKVKVAERDASSASESDMSDLTSRLEKVVQKRDEEGIPPFTPRHSRPLLTSPQGSLDFKSGTSLASRYDFGNSLKSNFNRNTSTPSRSHSRMHSYPVVASASTGSVPWPLTTSSQSSSEKKQRPHSKSINIPIPTLGSPRDLDDDFRPAPWASPEDNDIPFPKPQAIWPGGIRNHKRGSFDLTFLGGSTNLKKTLPGTPGLRSLEDGTPVVSSRFHSFPPVSPSSPVDSRSTVLVSSPLSDMSSSYFSPPAQLSSLAALSPDGSASPKTNYHQFLNRFCFFTGSESSSPDSSSPGVLSRASSTSSIDDFLMSTSPRIHEDFSRLFSPTRVVETRDDIVIRSGSITPTQSSVSEPRSMILGVN